jgi:hypothetical protein
MSPIGESIRHEVRELLPAVIYFVITLNIIGLTKVLMLQEYGITVSTFAGATLAALLVAKAVLIVGARLCTRVVRMTRGVYLRTAACCLSKCAV